MLTEKDYKDGQILLIDKELQWTSFQVVNKLRWLIRKNFNIKKIKVGHAGTLDPLASGLLIICTGKFTKRIQEFQGQAKEYTGTITLGATTPSYDLETEIDKTFPIDQISEAKIKETTAQFIGEIDQYPPVFSALKKDGKRLYEYAREGEKVEINSRRITINEFEITRIALPEIDFRVVVAKAHTSDHLAHDFGKALQNGGHLTSLRRTKIGSFLVDDAITVQSFENQLPTKIETT